MDTRIVKHPAFPDITRTVDVAEVDDWRAQGWLPLLDDKQEERYQELEAEVAEEAPKPRAKK